MTAKDPMFSFSVPRVSEEERNQCKVCHGDKKICEQMGKLCPVRKRLTINQKIERILGQTEFYGAAPSVFVGSWNYPRVFIGPLLPPGERETEIFVNEGQWMQKNLDEIVNLRLQLLRGMNSHEISEARDPSRLLQEMQEIAMTIKPVGTEVELVKRPHFSIQLFSRAAPSGPRGITKAVELTENPKVPRGIERTVGDEDLRAQQGIIALYLQGVPTYKVVQLLSIGLLGEKRSRRLVPTQWAITATDTIISNSLIEKVQEFQELSQIQVGIAQAFDNTVAVVLVPSAFAFEVIEGWITENGTLVLVEDYELFQGRKSYASQVAGAYYASRLGVAEYLHRVRRKAAALVFLEVKPGWVPLGVWRVRELTRKACQEGNMVAVQTLQEAWDRISRVLTHPLKLWLKKSKLVSYLRPRSRLDWYFKQRGRNSS